VGPIRRRGTLPLLTPRSRPVLCTHARRRCRRPALARRRQTGAASSIGRCDGASWASLRSSVHRALPASARARRQAGPTLKRRLAGGDFPRGQPLARGPSGGRRLPWLAGRARIRTRQAASMAGAVRGSFRRGGLYARGEAALAVQAPHPSASRWTSCRLASSQQAKLFRELGNVGLGTDESSRPGSAASCCSNRYHASTIIKLQIWEFLVLVID
jgi:hypothetical protein